MGATSRTAETGGLKGFDVHGQFKQTLVMFALKRRSHRSLQQHLSQFLFQLSVGGEEVILRANSFFDDRFDLKSHIETCDVYINVSFSFIHAKSLRFVLG